MKVNVDVERLYQKNWFDAQKTARQIHAMRQAGANLNMQVRTPESARVLACMADSQTSPWRFLVAWLLQSQGWMAAIGVVTYAILAMWMF